MALQDVSPDRPTIEIRTREMDLPTDPSSKILASPLEFQGAVSYFCAGLSSRRYRRHTERIAFINAHNYNQAHHCRAYVDALNQFQHIFYDGVGMQLAIRIHRLSGIANISGTDLIPAILAHSRSPLRVFLLGGAAQDLAALARGFQDRYPRCHLVGCQHGFFDDDRAVIDQINASGAELLLVGMGTPRQEIWLERHREALNPGLSAAVGGLFGYWSGRLSRAPRWLRGLGLEWSYILAQQPEKWRRYLVGNPAFVARALRASIDLGIRCKETT